MKYFFIGIVVAIAALALAIYLSDLFLFDIPLWAAWPLVGVPVLGGGAVGVIDIRHAAQHAHHVGRSRHWF